MGGGGNDMGDGGVGPVGDMEWNQQLIKTILYCVFTRRKPALVHANKLPTMPASAALPQITKYYHDTSVGMEGSLRGQKLPCFCQICLKWQPGKSYNVSFAGGVVPVQAKLQ